MQERLNAVPFKLNDIPYDPFVRGKIKRRILK
jgi:hypothetical protein